MGDVLSRLRSVLAGRYTLERELGRGGMATVWLARDLKHERPVALKVLRPELAQALGPERFLREITVTAGLDHPHILPLLDSGQADGFLYYTMPYVEGESLRERLSRETQLPIEEALAVTREVADALEYAHGRGVVHRDVKPENILLAGGHARVADFGIATALTVAGGERLTDTGLTVGTPAYMSPEQAAGSRELDGRSDVYSLACVLYEMLSGETPYTGVTPQAILAKKLSEPLPRISVVRETVPAPVEEALTCALARVPADRFATAGEFATALTTPLPGWSSPSGGVSAVRRAPRWRIAAAATLLVGVVVAVVSLNRGRRAAPLRAVAVLPCADMTPDSRDVALGDRWTEELIRKLARIGELRPKSWLSTARYRDSEQPVREIGAELNAQILVQCAVSEGPDEVRISLQLIQADDETVLWSEVYREAAGPRAVNALQSAATIGVARALGVGSSEELVTAVSHPMTNDPDALRLYRLGQHLFERQDLSALSRSRVYFDSAIARDSAFADAYVGLAQTLTFLGERVGRPAREYYPDAARVLRKAIALDGSIAHAHSFLGQYLLDYTYDWEGAEDEHRKALRLNPGSSEVHLWYAWHLQLAGRLDDAITEFRQAVALDPVAVIPRIQLARALAFARQLDRAATENRRGWELEPHNPAFAHNQAIIHLLRRQPDSAIAVLQAAGNPSDWVYGPLYALAGRPGVTRSILDTLMALNDSARVDPLAIAAQHMGLRNDDEALRWLEQAYADRSTLLLYVIGPHIFADSLRGKPRFEALRQRVGLDRARPGR